MRMRISLYVFAAVLIAAHFLRAGNVLVAALCLAAPLLFLLHRPWILPLLQALAYGAAACWLWTAWELVIVRRSANQPWMLAAAILLAVAALSALSGALLAKNDADQVAASARKRQ
ncbi:MAG: hypothetical protein HY847_07390 [Betaproteobacteria bacterium]|nr:hypothetical protein [Betaproteobacteria bacterium]